MPSFLAKDIETAFHVSISDYIDLMLKMRRFTRSRVDFHQSLWYTDIQ